MKALTQWFEEGDLTPLAVIISVAHYGPVLVAHGEHWFVAWAVGALIDLLHFRSIRHFTRNLSVMSGIVALATTLMASMYHLRFYENDWLLALPIPVGIAVLAWHAAEKARQDDTSQAQAVRKELELVATQLEAARQQVEDARKAQHAAERRASAAEAARALAAGMRNLNPLARDVVHLVAGVVDVPQAELAARHKVSESTISRLKAHLNGGG